MVVERQVERQVNPYKQVGAGVKAAGVKRRLVLIWQRQRSRKLMSKRATHQPSKPPRLDCNPTSHVKAGCWCTIVVTWTPRLPMKVWNGVGVTM